MKKIFTTILLTSMLLSAYAGLNVTVNTWNENDEEVIMHITKDTTIVVTEFEEDMFSGDVVMGIRGDRKSVV